MSNLLKVFVTALNNIILFPSRHTYAAVSITKQEVIRATDGNKKQSTHDHGA